MKFLIITTLLSYEIIILNNRTLFPKSDNGVFLTNKEIPPSIFVYQLESDILHQIFAFLYVGILAYQAFLYLPRYYSQ